MLSKIDLSLTISKDEYKREFKQLGLELGELQREMKDLKIPVAVIFEGWNAAGKGTMLNRVLQSMDARGFNVQNIKAVLNEDEYYRPFLWRFWRKLPEQGKTTFFDRSWYRRVTNERIDQLVGEWTTAYNEINNFEKLQTDGGMVLIKLFLHISKKTQKKRFEEIQKNTSETWRVTEEDWRHHRQYDDYVRVYDEMFAKTDTQHAQWTIVEAEDDRFATIKIFRTLINTFKRRIEQEKQRLVNMPTKDAGITTTNVASMVDRMNLTLDISKDDYKKEMRELQTKLREYQHELFTKRVPVVVAFEGWDAAGKGGVIKRLCENLDPRGYDVNPVAAPNDVEKAHHYLWRFWQPFPKAGHIAVFDRTWYGRVMVERIEGYCSEAEWRRAYSEINDMELQWSTFGTIVFKFWMQIDKDEQLRRFRAREIDVYKMAKITDEDWRNREKWDSYKIALDEMIVRTDTGYAPWTLVEANSKLFARIKVLRTMVERFKQLL
ncbi:MAG: phosphate--AMP phosphotransferase [Negativicutes bacterium]